MLDDTAAPEIAAVRLIDRFVEIELTEEPELATVTAAVTVGGDALTWTLAADRYTVRSTEALAAEAAMLTVDTTLADLAGTTLGPALTVEVPASDQDNSLYAVVDPREIFASTVHNRFGFHGRDHDPATGMVYFRNRWLDPEMGRFTTRDPLGHIDEPSLYAAFGNNPVNFSDPLGLCKDPGGPPGTVRVCIDTFISTRFVPTLLGYLTLAKGDNRSFEADGSGTYRTRYWITFDPESGRFLEYEGEGHKSEVLYGMVSRTGSTLFVDRESLFDDVAVLRVQQFGFNGFAFVPENLGGLSSDISYTFTFLFDKEGNVALSGTHDAFPSYEVYVYRDDAPAEVLHQFEQVEIDFLSDPEDVTVISPPERVTVSEAVKRRQNELKN